MKAASLPTWLAAAIAMRRRPRPLSNTGNKSRPRGEDDCGEAGSGGGPSVRPRAA